MKVFISSPNISFEQNSTLNILEFNNIDDVTDDDIVIGSATFIDELILKSLIESGRMPLLITLDNKAPIASIFQNMTLIIGVDNYSLTDKLIKKIITIKDTTLRLEQYSRDTQKIELNKSLLEELLLSYSYLFTHSLSSGLKSIAEDKKESKKPIESISIYIKENKNIGTKSIYIFLYRGGYFRIFTKKFDIDTAINQRRLRNSFEQEFERLIDEDSIEEYDGFENITPFYAQSFLLLEKIDSRFSLIDVAPTVDFKLKLYRDINFEELVVYPMPKRESKISGEVIELLSTISAHLKDKENKIRDIRPLLMARNLYEAYKDRDKYNNINADVFAKFIEKIDIKKEKDNLSRFDLSINLLRDDFKNIQKDKRVLSSIFYDIQSGININRYIKKQFTNYMGNFLEYKKALKSAEEFIEQEDRFTHIIDFIEESGLDLNQRVNSIDYISNILECLDEKNHLKRAVNNLYKKLLKLNLPSAEDYYDEYELEVDFLSKKKSQNREYREFTALIVGAIFRMDSYHQLSSKKLSKLISYILYNLSQEESDDMECFLLFANIYADNQPLLLLKHLYIFFQTRDSKIESFFKDIDNYNCQLTKKDILIRTLYGEEIILYKTVIKRKERLSKSLNTIGEFFKLISKESSIDNIIEQSIQNIIKNHAQSQIYCQYEIALKFLALFLVSKKDCHKSLDNFFDSFRAEYLI